MRTPATEHLIRQRVTILGRALPAARAGDVTSLHQARVATRRLRAALPLISPSRRAEKLARSLRQLTRALGPVRELDAALLILDDLEREGEVPRPAIQRLRASIGDERRRLHAELCGRLDEFKIDKLRRRAIAATDREKQRGAKHGSDPKRAAAFKRRAARQAQRLGVAMENAAGVFVWAER